MIDVERLTTALEVLGLSVYASAQVAMADTSNTHRFDALGRADAALSRAEALLGLDVTTNGAQQ